jgi:hypothetical protein
MPEEHLGTLIADLKKMDYKINFNKNIPRSSKYNRGKSTLEESVFLDTSLSSDDAPENNSKNTDDLSSDSDYIHSPTAEVAGIDLLENFDHQHRFRDVNEVMPINLNKSRANYTHKKKSYASINIELKHSLFRAYITFVIFLVIFYPGMMDRVMKLLSISTGTSPLINLIIVSFSFAMFFFLFDYGVTAMMRTYMK